MCANSNEFLHFPKSRTAALNLKKCNSPWIFHVPCITCAKSNELLHFPNFEHRGAEPQSCPSLASDPENNKFLHSRGGGEPHNMQNP
jgi:hypothetical protein